MVAVVDAAAELGIEKRAAAPAGMRPRFVEHDPAPLAGKRDGRGEPGEPGPDDMHRASPSATAPS